MIVASGTAYGWKSCVNVTGLGFESRLSPEFFLQMYWTVLLVEVQWVDERIIAFCVNGSLPRSEADSWAVRAFDTWHTAALRD